MKGIYNMNVELTIQEMYEKFPGMFQNRKTCYIQLFCRCGDGYKWKNGELVHEHKHNGLGVKYLKGRLVDGKAFQHKKLETMGDVYTFWAGKPEYKANKQILELMAKSPDGKKEFSSPYNEWLRETTTTQLMTNAKHLFNYPEDIKDDWKAAIEECKKLLKKDGFDIPETKGIEAEQEDERCI